MEDWSLEFGLSADCADFRRCPSEIGFGLVLDPCSYALSALLFRGLLYHGCQRMERQTPRLVRRHWSFALGYTIGAALLVGFGLMLAFMVFYGIRNPRTDVPFRDRLVFYLISAGVVSLVVFVIQVLRGPLVFTRNVVCRTCCRPRKLRRAPFFVGDRGYRKPKCDDCGGELEAAIFWRQEPE
jgi:hypothetical protein